MLTKVEAVNSRFHGWQYGTATPVDGDQINTMPNERVKDLFQTLTKTATKIQEFDILPTGPNHPDRAVKRREPMAVDVYHLAFLVELVTLGISHLLIATETFPGGKLFTPISPRHSCSSPALIST
jgi:hypothetical protein